MSSNFACQFYSFTTLLTCNVLLNAPVALNLIDTHLNASVTQ